jgi:hypothetical protein
MSMRFGEKAGLAKALLIFEVNIKQNGGRNHEGKASNQRYSANEFYVC